MPETPPETPRLSALSAVEVAQALKALPDWRLVAPVGSPEDEPLQQALQRSLRLRSFPDAMAFLQTLVQPLEVLGHHPRIENTWREVTLTFTTWDVEHRLTVLDVQGAETVERIYQAFDNQSRAAI
ncbi:4a-hydroxytetrahydrobiopterin dehydratase [Ideonella sp.]|uniref:4a-hydroxytetrahydrobiopterin dehydratase n=1 Tax=Ideonella sp. TaxID=1929293 RepID=UPI0037BFD492